MSICDAPSPVSTDRSAADDAAQQTYLSTTPAGPRDWRLAAWLIALSALLFICALPFVRVPLARIPAFVSTYESALAINDLITAILLFGKFTTLRSRALLVLACGYLFDVLMIIPHALTFPDVFSATGLFGAGSQTTAWLYVFWHGGFPLFILAYTLLRADLADATGVLRAKSGWTIARAIVGVATLVCALTLLATVGADRLPVLIQGGNFSRLISTGISPIIWLLSLIALIALWRRKQPTVLDLWLMVVMCAWLFDIALSAIISSARYDLGWYVGRSYGLLAASFVLAVFLLETRWLHDRLAAAQGRLAEKARNLEQRVHDRTEELRLSNDTLKSEVAERRQAEQELLRTRSFLDVIIENVPAMLLLKDAQTGKVVYLNRAGEELTGLDRGELIGKRVNEVIKNSDADLIEFQDLQALKSDKPYEIYENTMATRSRGVRLVRTKKLSVPDENGASKYLLAFCEDVTEQRKAEEQLRHAHKMEAIGQLTGGLAHDFNNLLAIIIGNLDVLSDTMSDNAGERELVQAAIGAALSGSDLTRRLLAFARRQPLQPEQVDVNALLENLSRLLSRTLGENIEIALQLVPEISQVVVDRVQLETAMTNLANNARDAMPHGGRLIVATHMAILDQDYTQHHTEISPGEYVVIEVSDAGEGMPPEVLERIFEPFYTTKALGEGTGLGLSMVFGFMKQSGGHINVYSERGCGTTFRLYLPPAAKIVIQTSVDAPPLQPVNVACETILVVEDNAKLRQIVVKQLSALGYQVVEADNAQRALDIIAMRDGIDLLFSDIVLPGEMDGCALARKFTALSPQSKILFTSGFPGARLTEMYGLDAGVRLLSKPYRKEELSRAVREILAERSPG
jgi:PAS domain S-box-containing protein